MVSIEFVKYNYLAFILSDFKDIKTTRFRNYLSSLAYSKMFELRFTFNVIFFPALSSN